MLLSFSIRYHCPYQRRRKREINEKSVCSCYYCPQTMRIGEERERERERERVFGGSRGRMVKGTLKRWKRTEPAES